MKYYAWMICQLRRETVGTRVTYAISHSFKVAQLSYIGWGIRANC